MKKFMLVLIYILYFSFSIFSISAQESSQFLSAWSSDGRWIASVTNGEMTIFDTVNSTLIVSEETLPNEITTIAWHPSELTLAIATETGFIYIYTVDSESTLTEEAILNHGIGYDPDGFSLGVRRLAWNFDGSYLASASVTGNYTLQIWESQIWGPALRIGAGTGIGIDWSPRTNLLVVTNLDEIRLLEVEKAISSSIIDIQDWAYWTSLTSSVSIPPDFKLIDQPTFSTDGQRIAFSTIIGELWMYDLRSGTVERRFRLDQTNSSTDWRMARHIIWSSEDEYIYIESGYAGRNGDSSEILVMDALTNVLVETIQSEGGYNQFDVSPYDGRIAYVTPSASSGISYFVPTPSFERLAAIAELCVQDSTTRSSEVSNLTRQTPATLDNVPTFVAQVEALPNGAIPPSCEADLLAVAEALIDELQP